MPVGDNKWGIETLEEWVSIDKERKRLKAEAKEREEAAATARNQKREIMMKVGVWFGVLLRMSSPAPPRSSDRR